MSEHNHCDHHHCDHDHCHTHSCHCCGHEHDHECHHHHESYSEQLIHAADEAWMEVLKEKMKEQIEKKSGKHLDELAKLITAENEKRWHNKIKNTNQIHEFKDQVASFFKK